MDTKWARLIVCGLILLCVGTTLAPAQTEPPPVTDAELRAEYERLDDVDRERVDQWTPQDRENYLRERIQLRSQGVKLWKEPPPPAPPAKYQVDPLLREAFKAYHNESLPREKPIELFEKYIQQNPNSPFVAECYFRIGALYSIHQREGEPRRNDLQVKYYTKAHELWGDKFSYLHKTAWATLANRSMSLDFKKEYYDWLLSFKSGERGPEEWYPYSEIEQTFNGRAPDWFKDDLPRLHGFFLTENLDRGIRVAEANILQAVGNHYASLADLARSYPDTPLGREARKKLDRLDRGPTTGAINTMERPEFLDIDESAIEAASPVPGQLTTSASPRAAAGTDGGSSAGLIDVTDRWMVWAPGVAVVLAAVVVAVLVRRSRMQSHA